MTSEEYDRREAILLADAALKSAKFPDRVKTVVWHEKWESKLSVMTTAFRNDAFFAILGLTGTGKTSLAYWAAEVFLKSSRATTAVYLTAPRLYARIRSTNQRAAKETESDVIDAMMKPSLLVIDEVSMGKGTDFESQTLNVILCQRHDEGKRSIIISAGTQEDLYSIIDPSTVSRMNQCGGLIVCDWESFRINKSRVNLPG